MKEMGTKKLVIIICIIVFLSLVGLVRVIAVIGGNITKSMNEKTDNNMPKSTVNNTMTTPIVKSAEQEKKEHDEYLKELKKKDEEFENNKVKLPPSNVISNTNFNYQGTKGVVKINGNYYVGYYCGLKEVWDAANKATYSVALMDACQTRGETNTDEYKEYFYNIKKLTPYIKSIQDMTIETASPLAISTIIRNYMMDTVKMNSRNVDELFYIKIGNIFNTNTEYYSMATNPKGAYDRNATRKEAIKYLSTLDLEKYPALNENILE